MKAQQRNAYTRVLAYDSNGKLIDVVEFQRRYTHMRKFWKALFKARNYTARVSVQHVTGKVAPIAQGDHVSC